MIGSGGGSEEASRARVKCAWAKIRELSPILTAKGVSLYSERNNLQGLCANIEITVKHAQIQPF